MYLLDTNALIKMFCIPESLSKNSRKVIESEKELFVSIVSFWEIAIKQSIGKINIGATLKELADLCSERSIKILNINIEELEKINLLPHIHSDPFDRLIISQAKVYGMKIVTSDKKMALYDVEIVA